MKTLNNKSGVTLMELVVAVMLATIVLSAGASVYLSSNRLVFDLKRYSKANRDVMLGMMHIEKNARNSASDFATQRTVETVVTDIMITVGSHNYKGFTYMMYNPANLTEDTPSIQCAYCVNTDTNELVYVYDYTSASPSYQVVAKDISGFNSRSICTAVSDDHTISITLCSSDANNPYVLSTMVQASQCSSVDPW